MAHEGTLVTVVCAKREQLLAREEVHVIGSIDSLGDAVDAMGDCSKKVSKKSERHPELQKTSKYLPSRRSSTPLIDLITPMEKVSHLVVLAVTANHL